MNYLEAGTHSRRTSASLLDLLLGLGSKTSRVGSLPMLEKRTGCCFALGWRIAVTLSSRSSSFLNLSALFTITSIVFSVTPSTR